MAQDDGQQIAKDLHDTFTFKNARDAVSHAIDTAKSYLSGGSSSPSPAPPSPTSSYSDQQHAADVKAATDSFKPKPTPKPSGKAMPKYKHGTDYVPKTGPAILHEGEAVLPKHEAEHYRANKMQSGHTDTVKLSKHRVVMHLHKGGLHRALHIPEGETIPQEKLEEARNSKNPHVREMANLAHTMEGWHKK